MEARRYIGIVAAGVGALALLTAAPARAGHVAVLVVPPFPLQDFAARGAVGLLVPGAGSTVTRAGAIAALERGRVRGSELGGLPGGRPVIALARAPRAITIYVSLPPPGRHHNVRRYPIAIVGGGYRGLLTSSGTRIPGLVSVADVAPTARALERGRTPVIRSRAAADAPAELARLDRRLAQAHDTRLAGTLVVVVSVILLYALRFFGGWPVAGRASLLAAPAALAAALALSAAGASRPGLVTLVLALAAGGGSLAAAALLGSPARLAAFLAGLTGLFLAVLAVWPEVSSLAAIGPHPDGGGRFYGITNQVETLVLAPLLVAGALAGPRALPLVGALALVTLGWSRAGADGGGALVLGAGFLVLGVRLRGLRLTLRRAAAIAAGAIALGLALVELDAALGGSSHVTRAVGGGPGSLFGDLAHRVHVSAVSATGTWYAALIVFACLAVLAAFAVRYPRLATGNALVAAIAVSMLVNDSPTDVAGFGALACAALLAFEGLAPPLAGPLSRLARHAPPRAHPRR